MTPSACKHADVSCLNQHELIRKYGCAECGAVMMCACDEAFGRRFLAHQLAQGVEIETQNRVPVTHGFQQAICNPCRGLPPVCAPAAAIHGRTSKIKRFYWRELYFRGKQRTADWENENPQASPAEIATARECIEQDVLDEIKAFHAATPLYDTREPSQADVLARCAVEVESLHPEYSASPRKGAVILAEGQAISPEAYVAGHFEKSGWSWMTLESVPFHALFGVMMWLLIEGPTDPRGRMVMFGSRTAFEAGEASRDIWMSLPEDFGTRGYALRRREAIADHFEFFQPDEAPDRGTLLDLFECWRSPSERLRQYLWAHRPGDLERARRLIEILPPEVIVAVLRYLVEDYWGRYLGWPDLLLHRRDDILLVEVKSSSDKLSADQMRWIGDNHDLLKLPFRLIKLHRPNRQRS